MDMGKLLSIDTEDTQQHWLIETSLAMQTWLVGDSIAVDGCCLTVTELHEHSFAVTLSQETLKLTHFNHLSPGAVLNLEPALRLGDALGGHWVSGHIDACALLLARDFVGPHCRMRFEVPKALAAYVVKKGSVTLNGVSLTINEVDGCCFEVNLIPHTLEHTNLSALAIGDRVNLETDMLARYVERLFICREKL